jgi:hypothetical protein
VYHTVYYHASPAFAPRAAVPRFLVFFSRMILTVPITHNPHTHRENVLGIHPGLDGPPNRLASPLVVLILHARIGYAEGAQEQRRKTLPREATPSLKQPFWSAEPIY